MRAVIIAVGSEMLDLDRADTHSLYIGRRLREKGILTDMKLIVRDQPETLSWIVKKACQRAQLVIVTGGLGPTEDDITREAVAEALKRNLVFREEIIAAIRDLFRRRGLAMPEINTRQAFVIEGAEIIANPVGTAPGQFCDTGNCRLILLPGPPNELIPMFEDALLKYIVPLANYFIYARVLKLAGITESETDALAAEIYALYKNPVTTILASPGGIELHLLGRSRNSVDEAQRLTDELAGKLRHKLQEFIFAEEDIALEQHVVEVLRQQGWKLAVAESCTGGGLGQAITNVPGSSAVFLGGVVAYSNEIKVKVLGVAEAVLHKDGAVSAATARQMAEGVRRLFAADIGLAVTGIAGPGGGTSAKPVGSIFLHLDSVAGTLAGECLLSGARQTVRLRAVYQALNLVRKHMRSLAKTESAPASGAGR